MAAADGPAYVAAPVKAAIVAKAPRRLVQAVAVWVAGVVARLASVCAAPTPATQACATSPNFAGGTRWSIAPILPHTAEAEKLRRIEKRALASLAMQTSDASAHVGVDLNMTVPPSPRVGEMSADVPRTVVLTRGVLERTSPASPSQRMVNHEHSVGEGQAI